MTELATEMIAGIRNEMGRIERLLQMGGLTVADLDANPGHKLAIDWRFWNERLEHWQSTRGKQGDKTP